MNLRDFGGWMYSTCGTYELVVDLRGAIVAAGTGLAGLTRTTASSLVGRPVTSVLRGPAMTAAMGKPARVTIRSDGGEPRQGVALRVMQEDRIIITVLPSTDAAFNAAPDRSQRRLHGLERLLDEVVRATHNPLSGVLGFASLAHLAPTPHRRRYYLDQVGKQAQRCRRLLRLLDGAAEDATPFIEDVELGEQVSQAIRSYRLDLESHGISIEMNLAPAPVWVRADAITVQDCILAIVAAGTLGIRAPYRANEVTLTCVPGPDRPTVTIRFEAPEFQSDALARRFDTADPRPDARANLADVELSAARRQLDAMGVTFDVESQEPGEEVTVILQLQGATPPRVVDQTRTPVPLRILAVDGDTMMGELYQELLGVSGHVVTACRSLAGARDALRMDRFDAVIADFFLEDGVLPELQVEAAANHPEMDQRLVLITGLRNHAKVQEWLQRGSRPVLSKPFTTQALLTIINQLTL